MTVDTCAICMQQVPRDRCPVTGCQHARKPRKLGPGELGRSQQDARSIAEATGFRVMRFMGRGQYEEHGIHATLAEALRAKQDAGRDQYGRPAMIYALAPGRSALFIE
jgi:hypothetical protein